MMREVYGTSLLLVYPSNRGQLATAQKEQASLPLVTGNIDV
jgi:hypothetical protein